MVVQWLDTSWKIPNDSTGGDAALGVISIPVELEYTSSTMSMVAYIE